MTSPRRLLHGAALGAGGVILFILFTYLLFPVARINGVIAQLLAEQGLSLTPEAHKTLLPGLSWIKPQLSSEQGALVQCDRLKVRLELLPLLTGRLLLDAAATVGDGQLDLEYGVNGAKALDLKTDGIKLGDIPFFKTVLGATAGGVLWSEGTVRRSAKGLSGELKLEVKQLQFSGVKLGAFPLPDVSGLTSQGMLRVTNGRLRLESFTLQGEGIYMRLSGGLPTGADAVSQSLNLTLEIMPKPEFLEKQKLVFMLLTKFMASPGVYRVPIRGTLLKPVVQ